ncbi:MAG TPA: glutamate-5-semialdehyde dehydrogenase [Acidimicrobiia bacterium]|jgi:glutamate-5-semialdehyde dehydrogenase|nr:proA [Acidimicrobiia bacterium]HYJ23369.1 glutamate-5-semialdehyde dehydrogenase [Acidimicrobiia bacterium]
MIEEIGRRAREASHALRQSTGESRRQALLGMAAGVEEAAPAVLEANRADMAQAEGEGITGALIDRLRLDERRISAMAAGLRSVASLPDPVGRETGGWSLYNGVQLHRVRVPLGVVAVIYEARPNVTADAAGLCIRSGNAVILRGSSYALRSNMAISGAIRGSLTSAGLPADGVQLLEDTSRDGAKALMQATEWVDLLVPRGGPGLIAAVQADATVPTVIDGAGNCHVYVDAAADLEKALGIVVNAKVQRPGVCNAAETLLVHEAVAENFLGEAARALMAENVELRGDDHARELVPEMGEATEEDWATEYLDLIMAVRVVPGIDAAIEHVRRYGTGHTEAIVTDDRVAADRFVAAIDTAVVAVNASTRFTDGEEFGFGAEIGNSTQKLHVRGPMGLESLTSERYVLYGDGQVR